MSIGLEGRHASDCWLAFGPRTMRARTYPLKDVDMREIDEISAATTGLADQVRDLLGQAAREFHLDVDETKQVVGSSRAGLAAFAPVRKINSLTAEQVASGTQVGVVALVPSPYSGDRGDSALRSGTFSVSFQTPSGVDAGVARLSDRQGHVVAEEPIRAIEKGRPSAANESVTVGDVTITVGWVWICISWDDPPGTPGGQCHEVCYGWR